MMESRLAQPHDPLLAICDLSVGFGGIAALNSVSFEMRRRQILGLIGPNGAGKTTLFNSLSRLYQPSKGDILMEGASILTRPPHRIAEIGISRTFQNVALFPSLSVIDNVRIGTHSRTNGNIVSDCLRPEYRRIDLERPFGHGVRILLFIVIFLVPNGARQVALGCQNLLDKFKTTRGRRS